MRVICVLSLICVLAACGSKPVKPERAGDGHSIPYPERVRQSRPDQPGEYTAGGLYRPGVDDGGPPIPPDISHLVEPEPTNEPPSRYGNRSPYTVLGKQYFVMDHAEGYHVRGIASWYGAKFHGRATSSLEPYDMYQFTAAHKTLPLPTHVRVTNLLNGRSVVVRVNDRGPFHDERLIDLSYAAAVKLGMHIEGTAPVDLQVLKPGVAVPPPPPAMPAAQAWASARSGDLPTTRGPEVEVKTVATSREAPARPAGRIWLQAASFAEPANARALLDRIARAGIGEATIQNAKVAGRSVYRVRVGPFASREASRDPALKLRALGLGVPTLITE
ncbi:MAG: septal ring lytic transglycosylase RlpA family protein [Xanthomonadales bacterium]|nr:septal ring lytic transglycosylase RlpA family protein [Xanthomonadales bacterium]